MNPNNSNPPRLAKLLLNIILPIYVKDEICGDLEEEFHQYIKKERGNVMANRWFWNQSLTTSIRYLFTKQRLFSLLTILIALSVFTILYVAVTFLTYAGSEFFNDEFWKNGNVHLLLFESKFWNFTSNTITDNIRVSHLTDLNSGIWSGLALLFLFILNKNYQFNTKTFSILGLALMFIPYLYGFISLQTTIVDNKEIGPLIAFMWLPVMYMVLPIAYVIVTKLNTSQGNV